MSTPDQRVGSVQHEIQLIQIAHAKCQGQARSCGETRPCGFPDLMLEHMNLCQTCFLSELYPKLEFQLPMAAES